MTGRKPTLAELCERINQRNGAVSYVQRLYLDALNRKRAFGHPRNPFKAVPGMEVEFQEADRAARYCEFILNEIEKKPRRKRELARFAAAAADRYIGYFIIMGLLSIAAAGLTVLGILIGLAFGISMRLVLLVMIGVLVAASVGTELLKRIHPWK